MAHRDDQTGEYHETYPLEAFIQAFDQLDEEVGTKAVEQAVGCQYRTAIKKLHELEDRGIVTSRRIGNAYLWSLAETGDVEGRSVDRELSTDEPSPEADEGSPLGTGPYDPTDEFE